MDKVDSTAVRLFLLGSFRLESDGRLLTLPPLKVRSLLAYLALHSGPNNREKVAALLWGDATDEAARHSLRMALTTARKLLGRDAILTDRETLQIDPDYPLWVDARVFESQARAFLTETYPDPTALDLSLYQGDLLTDFYDEWILPEREHLRVLHAETLHTLVSRLRALGEYQHAIEAARQLLALDPADEEAHQHIIFCYLALGDRSAAAEQYQACVRALQEELGVEPSPATVALARSVAEAPTTHAPAARRTNLPTPPTSFIGREEEVEEIISLLHEEQVRLLTLTGAGGSGKTRLAIAAASELVEPYRDGVWWVELAALEEEALVVSAVGRSLGLVEAPDRPMEELLVDYLAGKRLLLVEDNCEHLLGACARLAVQLLAHCPGLQILTTSRELLGAPGEQAWPVPTLPCPDPALVGGNGAGEQGRKGAGERRNGTTVPEAVVQSAAVALFVERAAAQRRGFRLTADNAADIVQICCRLDGIPLALELAAARVKVLTPQQIAARLDQRLDLLTGGARTALPRHQTLRATIEWSYDLLAPAARTLFRRLSAFANGFTLEAAEAICVGKDEGGRMKDEKEVHPSSFILHPSDILDHLARLIDKSLVQAREVGGEMRYQMLETIHAYARERLRETPEAADVHGRHLIYYVHLAETPKPEGREPEWTAWLEQLERERDNLRVALRRSLDSSDETQLVLGVRLAGALRTFLSRRPREAALWMESALAVMPQTTSPAVQARLYETAGDVAWWHSDPDLAATRHEKALAAYRLAGDQVGQARALNNLAVQEYVRGNLEQAIAWSEESARLANQAGDNWVLAPILFNLGCYHAYHDDLDRAESVTYEALALYRQNGADIFQPLIVLAFIAMRRAQFEQASNYTAEALELTQRSGNIGGEALAWMTHGHIWRQQQHYSQAIATYRRSLAILEEGTDLENKLESLAGLAVSLAGHGDAALGLSLLAAVSAQRETSGIPSLRHEQEVVEAMLGRLQAELDKATFAAAWKRGQTMTLEQAIALALQTVAADDTS